MAVDTGGGLLRPDGPPLTAQARAHMSETAYRDCLITVHGMLNKEHRARGLIEAALNDDVRAALRCRIGDARLTPREWDMLIALDSYIARNHMAPTFGELAETLGVSKVTIFGYANALERKGVVARSQHSSRSLYIVDRSKHATPV